MRRFVDQIVLLYAYASHWLAMLGKVFEYIATDDWSVALFSLLKFLNLQGVQTCTILVEWRVFLILLERFIISLRSTSLQSLLTKHVWKSRNILIIILSGYTLDHSWTKVILTAIVIIKKCLSIGCWIDIKLTLRYISGRWRTINSVRVVASLNIYGLIGHELVWLPRSFETSVSRLLLCRLQGYESTSAGIGIINSILHLSIVITLWLIYISCIHLIHSLLSGGCFGIPMWILPSLSSIYLWDLHQTWAHR